MEVRRIPILAALSLVVAIGTLFAGSSDAQMDQDAKVIAELMEAGSNLSIPHSIEFYRYFPNREGAKRAAEKVRALGCSIKRIDRSAFGPGWLVLATKTLVPLEADLLKLRKEFEALASSENGQYDGWETQVTKWD